MCMEISEIVSFFVFFYLNLRFCDVTFYFFLIFFFANYQNLICFYSFDCIYSFKKYGDPNDWTDYQIKTSDFTAFHKFFVTNRCRGEFVATNLKRISTQDIFPVQLNRMVVSTWDADLQLAMIWVKRRVDIKRKPHQDLQGKFTSSYK